MPVCITFNLEKVSGSIRAERQDLAMQWGVVFQAHETGGKDMIQGRAGRGLARMLAMRSRVLENKVGARS